MMETKRLHIIESPRGARYAISNKTRLAYGIGRGGGCRVEGFLFLSRHLIIPSPNYIKNGYRGSYFSLFGRKWFREAIRHPYDKEDWQYRVWIASERVAELWEDCPIDILRQNEVTLRTMRHRLRLISAKGAKDV